MPLIDTISRSCDPSCCDCWTSTPPQDKNSSMSIADNTSEYFPTEFWHAFTASVEGLNKFVAPYRLRKYQFDLLENGEFEIISPFSGAVVRTNHSRVANGRIAYRLPGGAEAWLLSGSFARQHELSYLVTREGVHTAIEIADQEPNSYYARELRSFRADTARFWKEISRKQGWGGGSKKSPKSQDVADREGHITMALGHANFAHHLWNELSGLEEWLHSATNERLEKLTVLPLSEPLGPLEKIFPRLAHATILRGSEAFLRGKLHTARLVVRPSSHQISQRVRRKVRRYIRQDFTKPTGLRLFKDAWPRVWISVRRDSRTADNLASFLLEVVTETFATYPQAEILLDGFSFPIGFFEDARTIKLRQEFGSRSASCGAFIDQLHREAASRLGEEKGERIRSVSGLDLSAAMRLAGRCDYYICHSGTLQHKVAWIHDVPGLIHCPDQPERASRWHAEQLEDGALPDFLPARFIRPSGGPTSRPKLSRNANYIITNVKEAANFVVSKLRLRIGDIPPTDE
jgi:hypothetical protein